MTGCNVSGSMFKGVLFVDFQYARTGRNYSTSIKQRNSTVHYKKVSVHVNVKELSYIMVIIHVLSPKRRKKSE